MESILAIVTLSAIGILLNKNIKREYFTPVTPVYSGSYEGFDKTLMQRYLPLDIPSPKNLDQKAPHRQIFSNAKKTKQVLATSYNGLDQFDGIHQDEKTRQSRNTVFAVLNNKTFHKPSLFTDANKLQELADNSSNNFKNEATPDNCSLVSRPGISNGGGRYTSEYLTQEKLKDIPLDYILGNGENRALRDEKQAYGYNGGQSSNIRKEHERPSIESVCYTDNNNNRLPLPTTAPVFIVSRQPVKTRDSQKEVCLLEVDW